MVTYPVAKGMYHTAPFATSPLPKLVPKHCCKKPRTFELPENSKVDFGLSTMSSAAAIFGFAVMAGLGTIGVERRRLISHLQTPTPRKAYSRLQKVGTSNKDDVY